MSKVNWKLDNGHSEVNFKVKHMMITNVSGSFGDFDANVSTEGDDFSTANLVFTIKTASISTNSEQRDAHLKSAEFFDAEKFPVMTFSGQKFTKKSEDHYELTGDLDLHGIVKPIQLSVEFGGIQKDPWGQTKAGFSVTGKINRGDFGLTWNASLETGGLLVSEEVRIQCEVQFIKVA